MRKALAVIRRIDPGVAGISVLLVGIWFVMRLLPEDARYQVYLGWGFTSEDFDLRRAITVLTHALLRGPAWHLLLNVAALLLLGSRCVSYVGSKRTVVLLLFGVLLGAFLNLVGEQLSGRPVVLIGISAGLYALISFIIALNPDARMRWIGLRASNLLLGLLTASMLLVAASYFVERHTQVIAHEAHLGGLIAGLLYARWFLRARPTLADLQTARRKREKGV